ncbi:PUM-HD domain-containing protein [Psidium guajava]|nr:PUM-HD domain-containing protein [Psidium guajava]
MVSAGNIDTLSTNDGLGGFNCNLEDSLQNELELLLQARRNQQALHRESKLNIYRSGSAPPTVEGSLCAVGGLLGNSHFREGNSLRRNSNGDNTYEEEVQSRPAYLSYYYSRENENPRLPPPSLSREDWRVAQRFQAGVSSFAGIDDLTNNTLNEDGNDLSLFSFQPKGHSFSVQDAEKDLMELRKMNRQASAEWLGRGSNELIGSSASRFGTRRKSFADILQDRLEQPSSLLVSRPQSACDIADIMNPITSNSHPMGACNGVESIGSVRSGANSPGLTRAPAGGTSFPHSFASVAASPSRTMTPEPQMAGRHPSTGLPPLDSRIFLPDERKHIIGSSISGCHSLASAGIEDIAAPLSELSLSKNGCTNEDGFLQSQLHMAPDNHQDFSLLMPNDHNQNVQQHFDIFYASKPSGFGNSIDLVRNNGSITGLSSRTSTIGQVNFPKRTSSANLFSTRNSLDFETFEGSSAHHHRGDNILNIGYSDHPVSSGYFAAGSAVSGNQIGEILQRMGNPVGYDLNHPIADPPFVQYMQQNFNPRAPAMQNDLSQSRKSFGSSPNMDQLRKVYLEALHAQQKQHYQAPGFDKLSAARNHRHRRDVIYESHLPYSGNVTTNGGFASVGFGSHMLPDEQIARFTSMMRTSMGESTGSWPSSSGTDVEGKMVSSLLDEFKSNKIRSFELSDILGHVVEFSSDQYGSRFIQQKLETAREEEKNMIFPEIIPHARSLMTDVFGNYVIQKFFEHGTESQRKELASQLVGHVLPLSLQMYGCRVIQKALEVVDVDQQTEMVAELDGSVMKCVRDQNGNHVIQKCIECVPQDRIQFIISAFYGQVVSLSMHPYGCRVIQRVLEHCDEPSTQQTIMDEIMQLVCSLSQDQYGNYVIQHILEHGRSHERTAIISKLAGQIVNMSQQKYASNVVEKCLTFGSPEERQLLINEILGSTEENEPLQVMMRDPFGNYVVQKVLETCNDQSLGFILSRIKVHLNTLKRFTYGKHIVARVEKLIATGERRIGMTASFPS